jgi:N-acetylneuraminic acid mutarotase
MRWRRASPALLAALALGGGGTDEPAEPEPAAEAGWTQVASMSQRRSYIAAAQVDRFIYAAGGMVGETGRPLATFARYDTRRDVWETLRRLPVATRAAAAAAVDGVVYVIGGTTPAGNTRAVWAWDGSSWRARAPLPVARFNHAAVALDGRIWVLGGYAGGREHADVFVYDPAADAWRRSAPLPRPTHAFGAVAFGRELWVIGGRRGESILREVWTLAPDGDGAWRRGPALAEPMELLGAAVVEDEIHAVWEHVYQVYDASDGGWRQGPRPLVTRHGLEVFAAGGALYTVGGCTTALRDSPVVERLEL